MDLKSISESCSKHLSSLIEEKKQMCFDIEQELIEQKKVLDKAQSEGDLSENSAYTEALKNISQLNEAMSRASKSYEALSLVVNNDTSIKGNKIVGKYSTVRFVRLSDNMEFVFKLYDKGLSDSPNHILDITCPIGEALVGCTEGQEFFVTTRDTGEEIDYRIIEVY